MILAGATTGLAAGLFSDVSHLHFHQRSGEYALMGYQTLLARSSWIAGPRQHLKVCRARLIYSNLSLYPEGR
jgi:hypothetical protein